MVVLQATGYLMKALWALQRHETRNLDSLLELLPTAANRAGLLTISNHISTLGL